MYCVLEMVERGQGGAKTTGEESESMIRCRNGTQIDVGSPDEAHCNGRDVRSPRNATSRET